MKAKTIYIFLTKNKNEIKFYRCLLDGYISEDKLEIIISYSIKCSKETENDKFSLQFDVGTIILVNIINPFYYYEKTLNHY